MDDLKAPPECTLTLSDASTQVLRWQDLRQQSIHTERVPNGARFTLAASLRKTVDELVALESVCCTSLRFSLEQLEVVIIMEVTSEDQATQATIAQFSG